MKLTTERWIRLAAGTFVLTSLALGYWVHHAWFLVTAFVGVNLVQSVFTGFCPLETILRHRGVSAGSDRCGCLKEAPVRIDGKRGAR